MALSGLSARSVLSDLSAVRLALSSTARLRMDTHTIRKSRQVHMDVKYLGGARPSHCNATCEKHVTGAWKKGGIRQLMFGVCNVMSTTELC